MSEHSVWCAHCALQAECISIDREMGLGEEGRKEGRKEESAAAVVVGGGGGITRAGDS